MELLVARILHDLDEKELIDLLMKFSMEDMEAFLLLKELAEDI